VVKFLESKLIIQIEDGITMDEIYGRAAKWIGEISLSGRLYPGGPKVKNISLNTVARGGDNVIAYLKMKVGDSFLYDIRIVHDAVDAGILKRVRVDGTDYFIYKFLKVKTFKRAIIYRENIKNQ
jgi:hypothetical protein